MRRVSNDNFILRTDSYKPSHAKMLPSDVTFTHEYLESRGGEYPSTVFFGLQYYLQEYFCGQVFNLDDVDEAEDVLRKHFMGDVFQADLWRQLFYAHGGLLPLRIRAVAEGTVVPTHNVLMTVENTDQRFPWLVGYLESLLMKVWYPTTIASRQHHLRKKLLAPRFLNASEYWEDAINFAVHDFSYRGAQCEEGAEIGSAAHLLSFSGTDTLMALPWLTEYYDADVVGFSVPAAEHSVILAHKSEEEAFEHILSAFDSGIVSVVSDTYDYRKAVTELWGSRFKERLELRNGKVVIRPDCYDEETQILTKNGGWKFFRELTDEDEVAQVTKDGKQEWAKPSKRVSYDFDGEMIHFSDFHGKVDSLVTPNHRVVYQKNNEMCVAEADGLKMRTNEKAFFRAAATQNKGQAFSPFDAFRVAFQADGSFCTKTTKKVRFNFSKERKIQRLRSILTELGVPFSEYTLKSGQKHFEVSLDAASVTKDFSWIDVDNLCSSWSRAFVEELSHWDGLHRNENRIKFDTTSKEVISVVERVALAAGYGVLISQKSDARSDKFSDVFTAHILKSNLAGGQSIQKRRVHYSGKVYCVTVPSGAILVKRNRSILVSGNSGVPIEQIEYTLNELRNILGTTQNSRGYHALPPFIGLIYGDGMNERTAYEAFCKVIDLGFVPESLVVGMGTGATQGVTRDTQRFAIKSSLYTYSDGKERAVAKTPKGDAAKYSKKGRLALVCEGGEYETVIETPQMQESNLLQTVFENGELLQETTYDDIIKRLRR